MVLTLKGQRKKENQSCSSTFVGLDVYNTCLVKNKRHFVISSYHGNVSLFIVHLTIVTFVSSQSTLLAGEGHSRNRL